MNIRIKSVRNALLKPVSHKPVLVSFLTRYTCSKVVSSIIVIIFLSFTQLEQLKTI